MTGLRPEASGNPGKTRSAGNMQRQDPPQPSTIPPHRVALIGFMGAGKSTVGHHLASLLGWQFLDVDAVIVRNAGRSIADIFQSDGEQHFRILEHAALRRCLEGSQAVLALGGGAVELPANLKLLAASQGTQVIYLHAPLEVLIARCELAASQPDSARRPVFEDRAALAERYSRRVPLYEAAAHIKISAEDSPVAVARQILTLWSTTLEPAR